MESIFDELNNEIVLGMSDRNNSIPIGLPKLGQYANIKKRMLMLLFSTTGAGKSAMIDTIVLNASLSHMNSPGENKLKPDFQLFSMERSKIMRIAKWLSYRIFVTEGEEIQLGKMLGWWDQKLTKIEHSLILKQKEFIDCLLNDYITIHEGAKTPKEVYKIMKDHYENIGVYDKQTIKGKEQKIYTQNDDNIITVPIFDHGNLTKTTQELPTKKQSIDKLVEFAQGFRDLENSNVIWVSQVNRNISGVSRSKDGEFELVLEDVKESGDIVDASDLAISLFDPIKYGQSSKTGYTPMDFIDKSNGINYFRSAQILKSSYSADTLRIPLGFNGFCGQFKELPKRSDLQDYQYNELMTNVLNKSFFLDSKKYNKITPLKELKL
jgi:hypothetical protein